jgi:hypothetical protein
MALVQDDHVVQAVEADTPNQPFDVGILPRTPGSNEHFFDPHMPHPLPKRGAIDAVPITQEISWGLVPRESVHDLLRGPRCGGVLSNVGRGDQRRAPDLADECAVEFPFA